MKLKRTQFSVRQLLILITALATLIAVWKIDIYLTWLFWCRSGTLTIINRW